MLIEVNGLIKKSYSLLLIKKGLQLIVNGDGKIWLEVGRGDSQFVFEKKKNNSSSYKQEKKNCLNNFERHF